MVKEWLKVHLVVDNELIDDCLMQVRTGELIGIGFNDNRSEISEVFRNCWGTLFHDVQITRLNLLQKHLVAFNIRKERLKPNLSLHYLFTLF